MIMNGSRIQEDKNAANNFDFFKPSGNVGLATSIYRYLPVERFLEMIESQANTLTHLSLWEDPFEAFLIRSDLEIRSQGGDTAEVSRLYDFYKCIYGQSWTLKKNESDVFWRAFGKRGDTIRIESTIGQLCRSLLDLYSGGQHNALVVKCVEYVSDNEIAKLFSKHNIGQLIETDGEMEFKEFFLKRKEFREEEEFRIVSNPDPRTLDKEKDRNGSLLRYSIDPSDLITSVLLDPCMDKRKVEEIKCRVMHRYPNLKVEQSRLFEWPTHFGSNQIKLNDPIEQDFWRKFRVAYRKGQSEFTKIKIPNRTYWGYQIRSCLWHFVVFNRNCARAELYIDSMDRDWNKRVFDVIREKVRSDETEYGTLRWERLDDGRASRISLANDALSFKRQEDWKAAIQWLCGALDELRRILDELANQTVSEVGK